MKRLEKLSKLSRGMFLIAGLTAIISIGTFAPLPIVIESSMQMMSIITIEIALILFFNYLGNKFYQKFFNLKIEKIEKILNNKKNIIAKEKFSKAI